MFLCYHGEIYSHHLGFDCTNTCYFCSQQMGLKINFYHLFCLSISFLFECVNNDVLFCEYSCFRPCKAVNSQNHFSMVTRNSTAGSDLQVLTMCMYGVLHLATPIWAAFLMYTAKYRTSLPIFIESQLQNSNILFVQIP